MRPCSFSSLPVEKVVQARLRSVRTTCTAQRHNALAFTAEYSFLKANRLWLNNGADINKIARFIKMLVEREVQINIRGNLSRNTIYPMLI
jgi:hypothetical protein